MRLKDIFSPKMRSKFHTKVMPNYINNKGHPVYGWPLFKIYFKL